MIGLKPWPAARSAFVSTEQVIDVGYSRIKWARVQAGRLDISSVHCSPVQQWRQPAASAPARALILSSSGNAFAGRLDRKSTRLNSSHVAISYAVFCLKKKRNSQ